MKYKIYLISSSKSTIEEILQKKSLDTLDQCIEELHKIIPNVIRRKYIDMIVIKKEED